MKVLLIVFVRLNWHMHAQIYIHMHFEWWTVTVLYVLSGLHVCDITGLKAVRKGHTKTYVLNAF